MNILNAVLTEAFGVALVGYVASLALAQGSAKKFKYSVDDNQVECAPHPSRASVLLFSRLLDTENVKCLKIHF